MGDWKLAGKAFAVAQLATCIGAAIFYGFGRDWRHMIYWAAAATITGSVIL